MISAATKDLLMEVPINADRAMAILVKYGAKWKLRKSAGRSRSALLPGCLSLPDQG
jgi:hypothetical protein